MRRLSLFALPNLYWITALSIIVLALVMAIFPVESDDLMLYLGIGRHFFLTGAIPATDPFIYSIQQYHWHVLHEWLSFVLSFAFFYLGGWNLIIILKCSLVVLALALPLFAGWHHIARKRFASILSLSFTLIALWAAAPRFLARTSLISDVLTALTLFILMREDASGLKHRSRLFGFMPFIFLCWVNLHPGFIVALAFLCLWFCIKFTTLWLQKKPMLKRYYIVLMLTLLACLINPQGFGAIWFPIQEMTNAKLAIFRANTLEWLPSYSPMFLMSSMFLCSVLLSLVTGLLLLVKMWQKNFSQTLFAFFCYLLLLYLSISAIRFVSLAAFSMAVIASQTAVDLKWLSSRVKSKIHTAFLFSILGLTLGIIMQISLHGYQVFWETRRMGWGLNHAAYPIAAADIIQDLDIQTPIFNQHGFGAFLIYRFGEQRKIFFHGAVDDGDFYAHDYLGVNVSPAEFDRIVEKYHIGAFLLNPPQTGENGGAPLLFQVNLNTPEWALIYRDEISVMYLRRIKENQAVFDKLSMLA